MGSINFKSLSGFVLGNVPILLISVHGGYRRILSLKRTNKRKKDIATLQILFMIYRTIRRKNFARMPSIAFSLVHRGFCDLNRPIGDSAYSNFALNFHSFFHKNLRSIIDNMLKKFNSILVLDIHGTTRRKYDIYIRVKDENFTPLELEFYKLFRLKGYILQIRTLDEANIRYGFYTIRKYSTQKVRVLQLEISIKKRSKKILDKFVQDFSDIIEKIASFSMVNNAT
ncbi:MAG: hypothetical protein Q6351_011055 [Candidatus Njordarchaeum guaymaensis]